MYGNEDQKQRINLSSPAASVLELERSLFENTSLSGYLNRIITGVLESGISVDTTAAHSKGDSILFRLNNRNYEVLSNIEDTTPGKYLKSLFETYARLSPSDRERIYYLETITDVIDPALAAGYTLELTAGNKVYNLRPYGLMADPYSSHLYLVGISRRNDQDTEEHVASFRLTRISAIKLRRRPGKLSAEERRQVERQLREVGVQYLIGSQDHITVRMTKLGQQVFRQRSYMRPAPHKVEGDIYHFSCAPMQIRNYFLSFGKEAEILSPPALRKEFAKIFRDAAKVYE